jgi:dTMP kinase
MVRERRPPGRFITFEGGEGSGKSVQAKRLAERLRAKGLAVTLTREPGGAPGAEEIRKLLLTGKPERWTPLGEALLFSAARTEHLARLIRPRLEVGDFVVSDRFADSTLAYQGYAMGLGPAAVQSLTALVLGGQMPDLTLILDVDVEVGLARAKRRGGQTRYERFDNAFHIRLREAYHAIAKAEPERCVVIDGAPPEAQVADAIWSVVARRFSL